MTKNKKLKYGSFAVAMTVVVLAAIIIVNALFTAISKNKSLYLDMTEKQLYTVSDAANAIFSSINSKNIEIIFFTEFDKMQENEYQKLVYEYAKKLEDNYPYISIKYIDSIENPEEVAPYLSSSVPKVYTTDVVITNGDAYRCYNIEKFFTFDSETKSLFAFNAEYRFATAIMQLTYDNMLACFTTGHGESTASSAMKTLFEDAGFEVRDIDLTKEDIPSETRVVIINDPVYDFTGAYDEVNEIAKVDSFLDSLGNLMVFSSPAKSQKLINLNEYLSEWGIKFSPSEIKDYQNSISSDGLSVVAQYTEEGSASSLTKDLRELDNPPKTIAKNTSPIEILWEQHNSIEVSPLIQSSPDASAHSLENDSVISAGEMPIMTVSMQSTIAENNERYYNYVLACGTSEFTSETYLNGNTYGNSDIIYAAMRAFGKEVVPVDLDFKVFDDTSLDITLVEANSWTVVLSVILPSVFLISGIIVFVRRRHL